METLNKNRLHIVMKDYLSTGRVPSPASANGREPIITCKCRRGEGEEGGGERGEEGGGEEGGERGEEGGERRRLGGEQGEVQYKTLHPVSSRVLSYRLGAVVSRVITRCSVWGSYSHPQ